MSNPMTNLAAGINEAKTAEELDTKLEAARCVRDMGLLGESDLATLRELAAIIREREGWDAQ